MQKQILEFQVVAVESVTGGSKGGGKRGWSGVKLHIKYFSRVEKFDGDMSKFREWLFDVFVVVGQIDQSGSNGAQRSATNGRQWDPIATRDTTASSQGADWGEQARQATPRAAPWLPQARR